MYFLSRPESRNWDSEAGRILDAKISAEKHKYEFHPAFKAAFSFFIGSRYAAEGNEEMGMDWARHGILNEESGLFSNAFLLNFLERHNGKLIMPDKVFADPRPYIHFTTVPSVKNARLNFARQCAKSIPEIKKPLKIMDIGCGDGGMLLLFLDVLSKAGTIREIGEILLVDPSKGMIDYATDKIQKAYPMVKVSAVTEKIEDFSSKISTRYDIALSSLSYHHMPYEKKVAHLGRLRKFIDHFLIFELDANNDLPELFSPDLAVSVYQSYGRIIDLVFQHDAPIEIANDCVDRFLMTEEISLLTQERGIRNDYHMTRWQWHDVFREGLGSDFLCLADSNCYSDEFLNIILIHYGR